MLHQCAVLTNGGKKEQEQNISALKYKEIVSLRMGTAA